MSREEELNKKELATALKRLKSINLNKCFDPFDQKSRPTKKQQRVLKETKDYAMQIIQGGNQSGKSQLGGRIVSWFFQRNHPYFDLNERWPDDHLLIIVCGRVSKQVEELWDKKIKPFLLPGDYREIRTAGILSHVIHTKNNSKIIFQTHHNSEEAREKMQSYVAHLVWFDELTDNLGLIEECQRRVQSKRGRLIMTFTPKLKAPQVKSFLERETPYSKVYRISMLENPLYEKRYDELMAQIEGLPEGMRNAVMYGDWFVGEDAVYSFDEKEHIEDILYDQNWPHIVAVDPAASGKMGYTLWAAEYSNAKVWYCIEAKYLSGRAPSEMVDLIEDRVKKFHVIKRITDPHEAWFVKEAYSRRGVHYIGVPNKRGRKKELIVNLNESLGNRIKFLPGVKDMIDELSTCQWSPTNPDKIVNSHHYHLADCAQYFRDLMPKHKIDADIPVSFDSQLKAENRKRILNEELKAQGGPKQKWRLVARRGRKRWRRPPTRLAM